jgi:hypothetical protein
MADSPPPQSMVYIVDRGRRAPANHRGERGYSQAAEATGVLLSRCAGGLRRRGMPLAAVRAQLALVLANAWC